MGQRGLTCFVVCFEKLIVPALDDDLHRVILSYGPVDSMSECLANDRTP
jgi:hypothetical protein